MTLVAAAAVAATTLWSAMGVARADERTWSVKQVTGAARLHHNGDGWRALRVGDIIKPGSRVETNDGGRLVLVRPGDSIEVAPNSRFDVPFKNEPNPKGVKSHVIQTMGTLLFKITTRPENPFGVKTPYLAAVIKGTTFTVSVDGPRSALHVSHGAVEVSSVLTGQTVMVRPGMTAAIDGARGGAMQVLGQRRGDAGAAGGAAKSGSAKAKAKAGTSVAAIGRTGGSVFSSGKGRNVITRTVGADRINVFESSRGLVRDLKGGPGHGGPGMIAGKGARTAAIDSQVDNSGKVRALGGAPVNARGVGIASSGPANGSAGGLGSGIGGGVSSLGRSVGNGLGGGLGNAVGGAAGDVGGAAGGVGNGGGNGGGNGLGNVGGIGGGNGKGKPKG
jgi:hypothetical protein